MYRKVELFLVPPFFVETDHSQEVIDDMKYEFDKERSTFGYPKLSHRNTHKLKRAFCDKFGLKLTFDSLIDYEIWKQGRTKLWLHRCLKDRGFPLSYCSLCHKITGYSIMKKELRIVINQLLLIH